MRTLTPEISFVVPVYGAPSSLPELASRISAVCHAMAVTYELILVDDRCPMGSWGVIERMSEIDSAVIGLRLSRNFGQHAAIQAGLKAVQGRWVVVLDCDLQDLPEEVPILFQKANEGWDIVQAKRRLRHSDPLFRRLMSKSFYNLLSFLTNTEQDADTANFGIYSRKVIDAITSWNEETKYFPAIVQWVGFTRTHVVVEHGARFEGRSSYSLSKLIRLALNVVVGFSARPLHLLILAGLGLAITSMVLAFWVAVLRISGVLDVEGWASLMLSIWFLSGCIMFSIGLAGLYIGRILLEAKGRPNFIIDETTT